MKRRSRSSDCLWLDHKPQGTVETGSILQPRIKTAKTGAKLSEKDLKDKDTSKYLLTHQSLDSDGEMATQLVKVCHFFIIKHSDQNDNCSLFSADLFMCESQSHQDAC